MHLIEGPQSECPPQFVAQPTPQITVAEGESITLTARVRPAGDTTLKVEWYRNGKPLAAGEYQVISHRSGIPPGIRPSCKCCHQTQNSDVTCGTAFYTLLLLSFV
ncbi:unnamed protein product [Protopolystoma xenopodis]|uniref:Ig-like domain-containing protein n=1 Tax=Protopolystoma xenopodis TaxID=117903 RepID=A0A448X0D7_9PLAT|nr:unnamed protein product [Protopolystoma xenopodis]